MSRNTDTPAMVYPKALVRSAGRTSGWYWPRFIT